MNYKQNVRSILTVPNSVVELLNSGCCCTHCHIYCSDDDCEKPLLACEDELSSDESDVITDSEESSDYSDDESLDSNEDQCKVR